MTDERVPCAQCGLPVRSTAATAFCCVGCGLSYHLAGRHLPDAAPADGAAEAPDSRVTAANALLARVVLSAVLGTGVMVFSLASYSDADLASEAAQALRGIYRLAALALSTPVMLLLAWPLAEALRRMGRARFLSSEALVLLGTLSAWGASAWKTFTGGGDVYFDTATVVLVLYSLGRYLDVRARLRSSAALTQAVQSADRRVARLDVASSQEERVAPDELEVGDVVRLRPGDVVPRDGRILRGQSFLDTSSLTGEEAPQSRGVGERVLGGWTLVDGSLDLAVEAERGASVMDDVDRILASALREPPRLVRLADRIAAGFLPVVALLFVGTVLVRARLVGLEAALFDGLSVVLIACPCAFGLATPLAFWAALGRAWKSGVLIGGGDVFERLVRARRVFFDKTGTLTSGELELQGIELPGQADEAGRLAALELAARIELASEHPIGRALVREAAGRGLALTPAEDFRARPGIGVEGVVDGRRYALRRAAEADVAGTRIELVRTDSPGDAPGDAPGASGRAAATVLATFTLTGRLRVGVSATLRELAARGLALEVLTGDSAAAAEALERELGVPVRGELLPADKVDALEAAGRAGSVFCGDGLNDAAALAAADVGIAVAGAAPKSLAAADVQLLGATPEVLPELFELGRRAVRTARLNLFWSFAYNGVGLVLAATGQLTPIFAALAMVGSSTFVVVLSSRLGSGAGSGSRSRSTVRPGAQPRTEALAGA